MENNNRGKMSLTDIQAEQEREQQRRNTNNTSHQERRSNSRGPRGSYNNNNNSGGGGGGSGYGGGGGGGGFNNRSSSSSGRRGSQNRRGSDRSGLPLERGCICSLKEKFGFIHCADRPAEIFFHYSEVSNVHPDHLQLDDEVEFRVGKSRDNPDKLAALEVNQLAPGTIEWEYEESPGQRFQGVVDRPLMRSSSNNGMMRRNSNDNDATSGEGLIRLLVPASEGNNATESPKDSEDSKEGENEGDEEKAEKMVSDGPKIRFTANDYETDAASSENPPENGATLQRKNSSSSVGGGGRLYRGDLVEFSLVIEKRTRQKFARNITLLQSERERARLAKEEQMLASATLERGVVVSLKQDFGFIRSNARRDEVYFHYSQVQLPEASKEGEGENDEYELKVGQELEFLVVAEEVEERNNNSGSRKQKTSARKVKFLPKGSVEFERNIATGVTGKVTIVPRADAGSGGRNSPKERDPQSLGTIRLTKSITTQDPTKKDPDADPVTLQHVLLHVGDSPGGLFTCSRGSSMGLWIREGDTLLFDVTYDFVDNAYYATPTMHLMPDGSGMSTSPAGAVDEKENSVVNEKEEGGDTPAADEEKTSSGNTKSNKSKQQKPKNNGNGPAVRLIALALAGRAEGTVHTMKEAYGFVHFSERPVDVHFKHFELLPETIQEDLRRNMGLSMTLNTKAEMMGFHKLSIGTEVQFDLSVQGTVMTQNQHPHKGGNKRGGAQANQHERENLKAQRILILPKGTILQDKIIGLGIKGEITKEDPNQPYAGILDLEQEFQQLSWHERHPLVCKMVDDFLEDEESDSLVFHDIQSPKEEEVIAEVIEVQAKGVLEMTHIPHAGDPRYQGRLCIRKISTEKAETETQEENDHPVSVDSKDEEHLEEEEKDPAPQKGKGRSKSPNKGRSKSPKARANKKKKALQQKMQPIKTIRYDKSSLTNNAKTDVPPGVGDIIICDVQQNRRTGKVHLENLAVVERRVMGADEVATLEGATGVGVVKEVVLASKFGFISVSDETASKRELLFFHFSSVVDQNHNHQNNHQGKAKKAADAVIHKGDEVTFKIGTEKNGKRVAMDVQVVSSGTTVPNKVDKNACRGYILVEPTDTQVGSSPKQSRSFTRSRDAPAPPKVGGRWEHAKEEYQKDTLREKGEGVILLIEDPTNMFSSALQQPSDGKKEEDHETADQSKKGSMADGIGKCHLHYRIGSIALHGAGAPTTLDSSTNPRRGDLVSFVKSKNNATGVKDIRVIDRAVAKLVRGHLENIDHLNHTATFVTKVENEQKKYEISLNEVVSCDPSQLKNKVEVEGVIHDNTVHGFCRVNDLCIKSKLGTGRKERPKLNLTVKKDRAGTIMAQSMMAKGPDGTTGFPPGWTTRVSRYAHLNAPQS